MKLKGCDPLQLVLGLQDAWQGIARAWCPEGSVQEDLGVTKQKQMTKPDTGVVLGGLLVAATSKWIQDVSLTTVNAVHRWLHAKLPYTSV